MYHMLYIFFGVYHLSDSMCYCTGSNNFLKNAKVMILFFFTPKGSFIMHSFVATNFGGGKQFSN